MSQTSIKASSSHDLMRHLCRILFCCFAFGSLLISVRSPSEMIFLCLSSYRTVLASVHFMKLSRKESSTSSAAQKEKRRHINNKHSNLSCSSQMWHTQTHHLLKFTLRPPSTHSESTFLTGGGDDYMRSPVTSWHNALSLSLGTGGLGEGWGGCSFGWGSGGLSPITQILSSTSFTSCSGDKGNV